MKEKVWSEIRNKLVKSRFQAHVSNGFPTVTLCSKLTHGSRSPSAKWTWPTSEFMRGTFLVEALHSTDWVVEETDRLDRHRPHWGFLNLIAIILNLIAIILNTPAPVSFCLYSLTARSMHCPHSTRHLNIKYPNMIKIYWNMNISKCKNWIKIWNST